MILFPLPDSKHFEGRNCIMFFIKEPSTQVVLTSKVGYMSDSSSRESNQWLRPVVWVLTGGDGWKPRTSSWPKGKIRRQGWKWENRACTSPFSEKLWVGHLLFASLGCSDSHSAMSDSLQPHGLYSPVTPWTIQSMEFYRSEYWSG